MKVESQLRSLVFSHLREEVLQLLTSDAREVHFGGGDPRSARRRSLFRRAHAAASCTGSPASDAQPPGAAGALENAAGCAAPGVPPAWRSSAPPVLFLGTPKI